MIKFSKVEPGMELFDVARTKMGNTTMSEWSCWKVKIISVDHEKRTAVIVWNGNAQKETNARQVERFYRTPPKAYRDQEESRRNRGSRW